MADSRPIGIFDSGLGGLTVVREIVKLMPNENIVYFGDTGRVPYGTKGCETIRKYALQDERFLLSHDVKMIVAACGTVSSVAADTAESLPVPFVEVVSHSVRAAVNSTQNGKIGILATSATINSGSHKKQILELLPKAQVIEAAGTLLVPIVEEGWTSPDDTVAIEALRRYLKPMIDAGVDTLILGCTHYPLLTDVIREIVGEGVALIDSGAAAADGCPTANEDYIKRAVHLWEYLPGSSLDKPAREVEVRLARDNHPVDNTGVGLVPSAHGITHPSQRVLQVRDFYVSELHYFLPFPCFGGGQHISSNSHSTR